MTTREFVTLAAVINHEESLAKQMCLEWSHISNGTIGSNEFNEANDHDVEGVDVEKNTNNVEEQNQFYSANTVQVETNVPRNNLVIRLVATRRTKYLGDDIYTCDGPQCPFPNHHLKFCDRYARNTHQLNCPYKSNTFQTPRSSKPQINHILKPKVNGAYMILDIGSFHNRGN